MFPPETSSRGFAATACWENLLPGCSPGGPAVTDTPSAGGSCAADARNAGSRLLARSLLTIVDRY